MTSISVDLDTLDSVRYKMRSFLVGSPTASLAETPDHLTVAGGRTRFTRFNPQPKALSTRREGSEPLYIPAYRLFETKKYNGPLGTLGTLGTLGPLVPSAPSTGCLGAAAQAQCCICLNNIRKGAMVVSMPICGHLYHKVCLFNWVDLSKNTFCPYCRQDDF